MSASEVIGQWVGMDGSPFQVDADGTCTLAGQRVPCTIQESVLLVVGANGAVVPWPFQVSGDLLTVLVGGMPLLFRRVAGSPASAPVAPATPVRESTAAAGAPFVGAASGGLAGAWDSPKGTAILRGDGTGQWNGEKLQWSVQGSTLQLVQNGQWLQMPFRLAGSDLIVGSGPSMTLTRAGLAGVWVAQESSLDPGIYLSFTQYVVLHEDGSVGYAKSEGYAQRRQVSEHIERFWSGRESAGNTAGGQGTWTSDGESVEIRFAWHAGRPTPARFDARAMTLTIATMGRLPGNENGPLVFERG